MRAKCSFFACLSLGVAGCSTLEINPFQTIADQFGTTATGGGSSGGGTSSATFRRSMTITLNNNNPDGDLELSILAWVNLSSVQNGDQVDSLIAAGYQQLTREVQIGSAFVLPVGTFVCERMAGTTTLYGEGTGGAIPVFMRRTSAAGQPTVIVGTITPDAILFFKEPPESCESVAFEYTLDGSPIDAVPTQGGLGELFEGSTGAGAKKTLAQVDLYHCSEEDPATGTFSFHPGIFLWFPGREAIQDNQFVEGQNVTVDFNATPDANGNCAIVTLQ